MSQGSLAHSKLHEFQKLVHKNFLRRSIMMDQAKFRLMNSLTAFSGYPNHHKLHIFCSSSVALQR